jgi:hypothetical protein
MSKQLAESETRLEDIARNHALSVRRVLREYGELTRQTQADDYARFAKEREVDRVISQYVNVHRALRKLRSKTGSRR